MPDKDIMKYSLGGFIIGNKGAKIQGFLSPINEQNVTPTGEQFLRLRGLGKFYHAKAKKNGQDLWKRTGEARFELTFAIYDARSKAKVVKYEREFERLLEDAFKYYAWIKHKEQNKSMAPDNIRNNINLQNEYLADKDLIEEQFRSGEIDPIPRMYKIEETDLRPSIEQTPYMHRNGIQADPSHNFRPERLEQVNEQHYKYDKSKLRSKYDNSILPSGYSSPAEDIFLPKSMNQTFQRLHQIKMRTYWDRL